ncbi:RNA polymerase sigma-70 factor [Puteibacter caeruleilacunae]|nr:RNA polymerase sigma-70 factor [Puteibacter caeruleilacunae]
MNQLSEIEILKELASGSTIAFAHVVKTYQERLSLFALHYLNDQETAKDVVQDVFSAVWESHKKFADVKNLSSWLYTMTKNHCLKRIDHLKVKQKHDDVLKYRQLELNKTALNELDTSPLIFDEINVIIEQTLTQLSPQARTIFEMSRFGNKKNKEIAEELNISLKTVEANITKCLKALRPALKNYLPLVIFLLK